jgi:hypothetical protein
VAGARQLFVDHPAVGQLQPGQQPLR